jgi:hypothetical protein
VELEAVLIGVAVSVAMVAVVIRSVVVGLDVSAIATTAFRKLVPFEEVETQSSINSAMIASRAGKVSFPYGCWSFGDRQNL